jgi:hypothetical protein
LGGRAGENFYFSEKRERKWKIRKQILKKSSLRSTRFRTTSKNPHEKRVPQVLQASSADITFSGEQHHNIQVATSKRNDKSTNSENENLREGKKKL